jgi:outer membrane protein OmpA-like peptidoglycan-associated protein
MSPRRPLSLLPGLLALTLLQPAAQAGPVKAFTSAAEIAQGLQATRSYPVGKDDRGLAGVVDDRPSIGIRILFDHDSAAIRPDSAPQLAECAKALQGGLRDVPVAVAGHTDSDGPAEYNRDLSRRRAEAVKAYLEQRHGIPPEQLRIEAYGEDRPLFRPERDAEDKAQNRRVEFIRLGPVP